jgi:hypothetical protein
MGRGCTYTGAGGWYGPPETTVMTGGALMPMDQETLPPAWAALMLSRQAAAARLDTNVVLMTWILL